ncbi:MAG: GTPase [Clostridia bacterium]|nr:GTPase [Clostridia bacterium]
MEIPVYLFTGFLEAGKTSFIQETLEDKRFNGGERTLVLMCEDGEVEYDPSRFAGKNVTIVPIENESELNSEYLAGLASKCRAKQVLVEYNGMWMLDSLYRGMPENWVIYQEMFFADANTILSYNANMRQLVVDKLTSCEIAIFNRAKADFDKMALHKLVRGVSKRSAIAYEYEDGRAEQDDIEDPLPFDINAPVVEIKDADYALFYRDLMDEMEKYDGKTVSFKGLIAFNKKLAKGEFVAGRHVMTCCVDDINYFGMICRSASTDGFETGDWLMITGKLSVEYNKLYGQKGPVIKVMSAQKAEAPEEAVATFY